MTLSKFMDCGTVLQPISKGIFVALTAEVAAMLDQEIHSLIDERKIHRVLVRYCMGADRRDAAMMKDCYWPEGMDDHGITPPLNAHEFVDAAVNGAIISKLKEALNKSKSSSKIDGFSRLTRVESDLFRASLK